MTNRCVLDAEVVNEILRVSARQRESLMTYCRQIMETVHEPSESRFQDATGRWIEQRIIQGWCFSYWLDSPVSEVRIVGIQRIKR